MFNMPLELLLARFRRCFFVLAMSTAVVPLPSQAADDFATTIKLGGIFTQFFYAGDDDEAPGEDLNPIGQFNYSRVYVESHTSLPGSMYVRAYTRLVVNNWSSLNAEQSYIELGSPYGRLRAGVHKPFNEQVVGHPAPQAALAVGDEIFSAMIISRTDIPQRDGLTFKRHVNRALGVAYKTPQLNGFEIGMSYYPAQKTGEGPIDRSQEASNAVDVSGSYRAEVMGGDFILTGGYFRATASTRDSTGVRAWNTSLKWRTGRWEFGGAFHKSRLANGSRDVAWAVGLLHRRGPWAFSTDYRSSNRRPAKGAPVGEYADRVFVQTNYQIVSGISVGVAAFYSEQRDLQDRVWRGKGGTVGLKLSF